MPFSTFCQKFSILPQYLTIFDTYILNCPTKKKPIEIESDEDVGQNT